MTRSAARQRTTKETSVAVAIDPLLYLPVWR